MAEKKQIRTRRIWVGLFWIIEVALYLGFLWLDITNGSVRISTTLKFFGIVLCFLYSVFRVVKLSSNRDSVIVSVALFFTVCADVCLLLTNRYQLGLVFFSLVQSIYLYRIHCYGMTSWRKHLIQRGGVIALAMALMVTLQVKIDVLLILTVFYFVNISFNVWDTQQVRRSNAESYVTWDCFTVGMVLFLLCDINVGIYNMSSYLILDNPIYNAIYNFSAIAMWLFYLPGQTLIAISGKVNSSGV